MKRQLVLRLEAEAGIAEAVNFYLLQSDGRKQNFIQALDAVFDSLLLSPRLYAIRFKNIRRVNIPKFSYALCYEVVEAVDPITSEPVEQIILLRFFHERSNITASNFE